MDAKELIARKVEERKAITDYHLTTKKAQATVLGSTPTLTITVRYRTVPYLFTVH
jgi:hypothetical protein